MTYKVLHAPLKAPLAKIHPDVVVSHVRSADADMVGFTEAYGIIPSLSKMATYRMVMEAGGKDQRRGQRDNPILVRDKFRSFASGQTFGAAASKPVRIAPERWMTFSTVRLPNVGITIHIALHPHAGVQDPDGSFNDSARVPSYVANMDRLGWLLGWADDNKWSIIVTGDLNFRDKGDEKKSPYTIMRNHKLDIHTEGLDCIAGSKSLHLSVKNFPAPATITDHPFLLGTIG